MNPEHHVWSRAQPGQAQPRSHAAARRDYREARLPGAGENQPSGSLPSPARVIRAGALSVATQCWLGHLRITANAAQCVPAAEILDAFARHAAGEWGAMDAHDRQQNDRALITRGRLLSVHTTRAGQPFWIITDSGWGDTNVELNISVVMLSLQKCGVATECPEITHPRGGFTQHFCDPREALWRESTTPGSTARDVKQPGPRLDSERHGATGGRFLSGVALRAMWPGRGVYAVCQLHVIVGLKTHCLLPVMLSSRAAKARKTGGIGLNSTFLKTQHNDTTLLLPEDY